MSSKPDPIDKKVQLERAFRSRSARQPKDQTEAMSHFKLELSEPKIKKSLTAQELRVRDSLQQQSDSAPDDE